MGRRRRLRTGFTTGAAAAAAAKGALLGLFTERPPAAVEIGLLAGGRITVAVHAWQPAGPGGARCSVIKDAGDDPDVTHGAEIGAAVHLADDPAAPALTITGGPGVGRVTKPGLEVPPGEPAINPGPRRMIAQAVAEAFTACGRRPQAVAVEIFVPQGAALARRTLNARLGIVGGISILGTTGVVRPLSHAAFEATIAAALAVAAAAGLREAVLTTGRRSERHAQALRPELPEEAFVQIGDFFGRGLALAAAKGFSTVTIAAFFGKALKMAAGAAHTHASRTELDLAALADRVAAITADPALAAAVAACNTAREAFARLGGRRPEIVADVGRRLLAAAARHAGPAVRLRGIILDYEGRPAFDSGRGRSA